ncbi:hypothetical protein HK104_006131, partial [Borealophlyctis nickersoniae]
SSDISKHFADQGIKIPIRRKTRRRYGGVGDPAPSNAAATAAGAGSGAVNRTIVGSGSGGGGGGEYADV